jgi:hypothetical protein
MADTKTNVLLDAVDKNEYIPVLVRGKVFKIKRMTNGIERRYSRYVANAMLSYSDDNKKLIVNMTTNSTLLPKCVSLIILHNWFRVTLFHQIYWRYLDKKYSIHDLRTIYETGQDMGGLQDFFECMASLQANNQLIQRMSEISTANIHQELKLGQETI